MKRQTALLNVPFKVTQWTLALSTLWVHSSISDQLELCCHRGNDTSLHYARVSQSCAYTQVFAQEVGGKVHPPPLLYFIIDATINVPINQSIGTPKEEQPQLQHGHWSKASWRELLAVCLHSLPVKAPTSRYFLDAKCDTYRLKEMSRKHYLRKITVANWHPRLDMLTVALSWVVWLGSVCMLLVVGIWVAWWSLLPLTPPQHVIQPYSLPSFLFPLKVLLFYILIKFRKVSVVFIR
ncbi:hypothetical protein E2C01_059972 [Portunus trituberculatus]|uniref:Uncharacterized protein n=1 Tax=Portunus trituberculatus TaxID=210409 RepID=A0A5B7H7B2_PORTR|nr:hypothetical protein [Portunus trituberculatus]